MSDDPTLTDRDGLELLGRLHLGDSQAGRLAEVLRHEVSARELSTRRVVCDAALGRLAYFGSWDREEVRGVLGDLERMGDVWSAPGGRVAPAPLRIVNLGGGRFGLYGGAPSSRLGALPGTLDASAPLQRFLQVSDNQQEQLAETVDALGGMIIPVERWTGLDRSEPCGPDWLAQLDSRFQVEKADPSGWDQEGLDEWRVYTPDAEVTEQRKRWTRRSADGSGSLWRARHANGWWVYAWCPAGEPASSPALKLRHEEALRTAFSLDVEAEAPLAFRITAGDPVELVVDAFLPLPEFRLLNVAGQQVEGTERGHYCYEFTPEAWSRVSTHLAERLAVKLKEGEP